MIDFLPNEIIKEIILHFTEIQQFINFSLTCRKLYDVTKNMTDFSYTLECPVNYRYVIFHKRVAVDRLNMDRIPKIIITKLSKTVKSLRIKTLYTGYRKNTLGDVYGWNIDAIYIDNVVLTNAGVDEIFLYSITYKIFMKNPNTDTYLSSHTWKIIIENSIMKNCIPLQMRVI